MMARWIRPLRFAMAVVVVAVVSLGLSGCDGDASPRIGTATAGVSRAVVSWLPPPAMRMPPVTAYVVTPWIGLDRQTPVVFNSDATTQTVTGLTNGVAYTFTVHAVDADGNDTSESRMSNPVTPSAGATAMAAGAGHTCAIVAGGAVDCWGYNGYGQLGNGTTTDSSAPVAVAGLTGATAITAGELHTCAIVAGGAVDCWGYNGYGQLGDGTTTDSSAPVAVAGLTGATAITAGEYHSCAIVAGGAVDCWGLNFWGQLGDGTTTDSSAPVAVAGLTGATAITAGYGHSCAIVAGGAVDCWGYNGYGQLGTGPRLIRRRRWPSPASPGPPPWRPARATRVRSWPAVPSTVGV